MSEREQADARRPGRDRGASGGDVIVQIKAKLLGVSKKISQGLLHSALQVECPKLYLRKAPDLIADMILDVKEQLFGDW